MIPFLLKLFISIALVFVIAKAVGLLEFEYCAKKDEQDAIECFARGIKDEPIDL